MSRPIVSGVVYGALGGAAVASLLRGGIPTMARLNVAKPIPYLVALVFFATVIALPWGLDDAR
ncbi:MAG: hypothetical protein M3541_08745 [Acidobacteriota bacterium]|nr:hypothetical protein [Acidobacteriota bacterium]